MNRWFRCSRGVLVAAPLLAAAFGAGTWFHLTTSANAEVRTTTPDRQFKSGGARSELVLIEIAEILKRIETRLERIEKSVVEGTPRPDPPSSE